MLHSPTLFQPVPELYPGRNSSDLGKPLLVNDSLSKWGALNESLAKYDNQIKEIIAKIENSEITRADAKTAKTVAWSNCEVADTIEPLLLYKVILDEYLEACINHEDLCDLLATKQDLRISIQSQLNEIELENQNNDEDLETEESENEESESESDGDDNIQTDVRSNGYSLLGGL